MITNVTVAATTNIFPVGDISEKSHGTDSSGATSTMLLIARDDDSKVPLIIDVTFINCP